MIQEQKKEVLGIIRRLRNRDFSGNTGLAVKNSAYNLSTSLIAKIGSLLFTVIIARMLMPELFGLYSLALSTTVLFAAFSDLGIGTVLIKYLASESSKKKGNIGKYYYYLLRLKLYLSIGVSLVLVLGAYLIANNYYHKPIFFALLAGGLYVFANSMLGFFSSVFQAFNDFKKFLVKEVIFQVLRLVLIPLAIFLALKYSSELVLFSVMLSLAISFFFAALYLYLNVPRIAKSSISLEEKKKILLFILPMSTTILSGIFFGYVDTIILGRFVEAEFIGYYQAALALIGSAGAFVGFTAGALFPLFSQMKGEKLNLLFKRSKKYTLLLGLAGMIASLLLSRIIILVIYGSPYLQAVNILRIFSVLLVLDSLIGIYTTFYISQNKPIFVAKILVFSTVLNIILNYFFISYLVSNSHYLATIGAACATIIAKIVHLCILVLTKNISR
ncbi:Polysaccharide biosynthesis protein [uncultured archaeon]|nr:Polysaccharide biosynthesis protein [uncultured archaeon]